MPRQFHAKRKVVEDPNERGTPWWVIRWQQSLDVRFAFDVCATGDNYKADNFWTKEEDGLSKQWGVEMRRKFGANWSRDYKRIWCNPPYGRGLIRPWLEKARHEWEFNNVTTHLLLPADPSTKWFSELFYDRNVGQHIRADVQIIFFEGRMRYEGAKGRAMFPSMLAIIGRWMPKMYGQVFRVSTQLLEEQHSEPEDR